MSYTQKNTISCSALDEGTVGVRDLVSDDNHFSVCRHFFFAQYFMARSDYFTYSGGWANLSTLGVPPDHSQAEDWIHE